jgi:hypothetical protein
MMKTLLFLVIVGFAVYWFALRGGGCGAKDALACPAPALEEGVGLTLNAREVCRGAGYLCTDRASFQVMRWPLDKGKLRVRMRMPEFADAETGRQLRDAAIEGIMEWNNHPFPIVVDSGKYTVRMWDIGVVWSQGLFNEAAGLLRQRADEKGKRFEFAVDGLTVVVPPISTGEPLAIAPSSDPEAIMAQIKANVMGEKMGPALLTRVKAVAMHEMGHALGLLHSDSEDDIMFPQYKPGITKARASTRDLRTVDTLYTLPNGAMVQ